MVSAIILAGGRGSRFGSSIPKPFMSLNGKAVIQYSIDVIEPLVDELVIVSNTQYKDYRCIKAGETRSLSVENGLAETRGDLVIIHDGARPFLRERTVVSIKEMLKHYDCVDTVSPITDGFVAHESSLSKDGMKLGLTPEGFKRSVLEKAFNKAEERHWQDEITMVQSVLEDPKVGFVYGESFNSKITFEKDLAYAEGIMKFWSEPITTKPKLDKKVLIFGGSSGIGKKCSEYVDCYCPTRKEIDLSKKWRIDLSPYSSVIYSAGEYANEDKIMAVNFESAVHLVKQAQEQGWRGNIVFLSSTAATYGRRGIPIYSASKSALNAYIEAIHEELAEEGIYINAIAPAKTDTRLQEAINPNTPKEEMMTTEYVADYVLRYTETNAHGDIIYLRKGFDEQL
jgi:ribitol-5-phosphate 2-dehydrogenase (NADP+) / D-ribitol-5-phosphate cytidylyltransferase